MKPPIQPVGISIIFVPIWLPFALLLGRRRRLKYRKIIQDIAMSMGGIGLFGLVLTPLWFILAEVNCWSPILRGLGLEIGFGSICLVISILSLADYNIKNLDNWDNECVCSSCKYYATDCSYKETIKAPEKECCGHWG